jgi:hypothetical protein
VAAGATAEATISRDRHAKLLVLDDITVAALGMDVGRGYESDQGAHQPAPGIDDGEGMTFDAD